MFVFWLGNILFFSFIITGGGKEGRGHRLLKSYNLYVFLSCYLDQPMRRKILCIIIYLYVPVLKWSIIIAHYPLLVPHTHNDTFWHDMFKITSMVLTRCWPMLPEILMRTFRARKVKGKKQKKKCDDAYFVLISNNFFFFFNFYQ